METEKLNVIIVDDEEEARDILARQLQRVGNIEISGKASGVDEALEMIIELTPDIVFLDIQMPEKDGFELIKSLRKYNQCPSIIFVTAHNEYAINAVKISAFDYLLKPIVFDELREAILRYRSERKLKTENNKIEALLETIGKKDKICFNIRTGYIYISPKEIVYCQADVNYTDIHLSRDRKEVVTINIGKVEESLPSNFFRISRSHLINTEYLVKADRKTKCCELYKDGEKFTIPASPKQIRELEQLIHLGRA
jgi:two-component system LytT family response regulator